MQKFATRGINCKLCGKYELLHNYAQKKKKKLNLKISHIKSAKKRYTKVIMKLKALSKKKLCVFFWIKDLIVTMIPRETLPEKIEITGPKDNEQLYLQGMAFIYKKSKKKTFEMYNR